MSLLQNAKDLNAQAQRLHSAVGLRPTQTSLVLLSLILVGLGTDEEQIAAVEPALRESVIALKGVHNCRAEAIDAEAAIMAMPLIGAVAQAENPHAETDLRIQELESELAEAKAALGERISALESRLDALEARPADEGPKRGRGRGKADAPASEAPADAKPE